MYPQQIYYPQPSSQTIVVTQPNQVVQQPNDDAACAGALAGLLCCVSFGASGASLRAGVPGWRLRIKERLADELRSVPFVPLPMDRR